MSMRDMVAEAIAFEAHTVDSMTADRLAPAWRLMQFFGISTEHGMRHAMGSLIRLIRGKLPDYPISTSEAQCLACVIYRAAQKEFFYAKDLPEFGLKSYRDKLATLRDKGLLICDRIANSRGAPGHRYTLAISIDRFL